MSGISESELEKAIGYSFKDKRLLIEALTHKSFYHENGGEPHNERLEFLGDSVLGLVVVEHLYGSDEALSESIMAKIKSYVVKRAVLAGTAKSISLGSSLRLSKGEDETGGRQKASILSDALEALIGAVYLDGGIEAARTLILRLLRREIEDAVSSGQFHDYKTELQEACQMRFGLLPEYRLIMEKGEEHKKVFTVEVFISGKSMGLGVGGSKKEAQSIAAKEAIKKL